MKYATRLETTVHECDKTGRIFLRFVPVIRPLHCASGELRTAQYEAWLDEPETISAQQKTAMENAKTTLAYLFS